MTKPERSLIITFLLALGLAYGIWAPPRKEWLVWAGTWLVAVALAGLAAWAARQWRPDREPEAGIAVPGVSRAQWAHEIRTPLMHIGLYLRQLRASIPTEAQGAVDELEAELARVGDLLESMSLLSQRHGESNDVPIYLNQWIGDALPLYREAAQTLGHELETHLAEVPLVRLRADHLKHILSNLLSNSFRHAEPHSVIRISVQPDGPLWVSLRASNPSAPPTCDPERLVEPFVRGSDAEAASSSGLGLSVVDHLVRAAGGRVRIEWKDGIFEVVLMFPRVLPESDIPGGGKRKHLARLHGDGRR